MLDDSVNAEQLRGMLRLRRAEIDTPGGLPVGVQIMGPLFEDDTPITFAHALADVVGGYEPPPEPAGDVPQPAGASTGHPSWR